MSRTLSQVIKNDLSIGWKNFNLLSHPNATLAPQARQASMISVSLVMEFEKLIKIIYDSISLFQDDYILRSCPHGECEQVCSEPCQDDPCSVPCDKLLRCGHPCIGLCGEPCPLLCRVCHPEAFAELFLFGFEDEDDATFLQLADCGHIIHAESMDKIVKDQSTAQDQEIKMIECPRCKTSVKKTIRYNGFINKHLKKVESVKKKLRGEVEKYC